MELMFVIDDDNKVKAYLVDQFGDVIEELNPDNFEIHLL